MAKKKKKKKVNAKKTAKIGITMGRIDQVWTNGLHQNTVILAKILKQIGYDVYLIVEDKGDLGNEFHGIKLAKFGAGQSKNMASYNFDIVLYVSFSISPKNMEVVRKTGCKQVIVEYGNLFQIFNETAIGKGDEKFSVDSEKYNSADALWASPHFERNAPWYKSFTDVTFDICPYVWNPMFFDAKCKELGGDPQWNPQKDTRTIAIHEPNINVIKTCVIPLSIVGILNKRRPELIKKCYSLNTKHLKDIKPFEDYIHSIGLVKKGSFDERRTTPFMVCSGVTGTSVFHHTNNSLNYLPLEMMNLGYPVVHNSDDFKSAGYFYNEIDSVEGANQLEIAISTHEENYDKKLEESKELIWKYSTDNPDNVQGYKDLIEKLLDN